MSRASQLISRSACSAAPHGDDVYDTLLHVAALFIILTVSTVAAAFPLLAVRFPRLRIPPWFFFIVRHFGTGVLIATAFCHLLPTAFASLNSPCLSEFWTQQYPAMPGAIALCGVFLVAVIEMCFHSSTLPETKACLESPIGVGSAGAVTTLTTSRVTQVSHNGQFIELAPSAPIDIPITGVAPHNVNETRQILEHQHSEPRHLSGSGAMLQEQQRMMLQCVLLEIGILFHSVFIGMALSVSVGSDFIVLLVAIAFHQTFEGLALGARIASIDWARTTWRPWLMALAYGCTTPIGQAIGLATHSLYSPASVTGLVLVGTMNAISSGLLIFASLIELLAEDFLSERSWQTLRGRARIYACFCLFMGAFSMSLVGAWA